jgi:glyoxylase-like metal-dependent hydrolase (beta-lactamase superfamily II)
MRAAALLTLSILISAGGCAMSRETAKDDSKGSQPEPLKYEVFMTPGIPVAMAERPPGVRETYFQAMASTLIYGKRDAVLVDTFMTVEQARALADWVASKDKNLTTIYITHGHGDHWFGVATILQRFPNARVVATPDTIAVMRYNSSPEGRAAWGAAFPGQIPEKLVLAEPLVGNAIELEGRELVIVELGHTDTDHTTCLHVPSIGLVVAGDAAYNDVHLYFVESTTPEKRQEWLAALDKIESLHPRVVIASHKRPENDDSPRIIEETRKYIRDFDRLAATTRSAQELYDKMRELYPGWVNPTWALWSSAHAVKP